MGGSQASLKGLAGRRRRRSPQDSELTFFLRAIPSVKGWTWSLFARTGASGAPRLVYAANQPFATKEGAVGHGRRLLAEATLGRAISEVMSRAA